MWSERLEKLKEGLLQYKRMNRLARKAKRRICRSSVRATNVHEFALRKDWLQSYSSDLADKVSCPDGDKKVPGGVIQLIERPAPVHRSDGKPNGVFIVIRMPQAYSVKTDSFVEALRWAIAEKSRSDKIIEYLDQNMPVD